MLIFILIQQLFSQILILPSKQCQCQDIKNKDQCQSLGCRWNLNDGECEIDCQQLSETDCQNNNLCSYLSQQCINAPCTNQDSSICSQTAGCYLDGNNTCQFMQCDQDFAAPSNATINNGDCQYIPFCEYQTSCQDSTCNGQNSTDCNNIRGCQYNYNSDSCDQDCLEIQNDENCMDNDICIYLKATGQCLYKDCKNFKTKSECENSYLCSFNNNTCADKTCSDSTDPEECNNLGCYYYDEDCNDNQQSQQHYVFCDKLSEQECQGILFQQNGQYCYWNDNQCQSQKFTQCQDANNITELCLDQWCTYNQTDETCSPKVCTDIDNEQDCNYVMNFRFKNATLCQWLDSACLQANDTNYLDKTTCQDNTFNTFTWDESQQSCQKCLSYLMKFIFLFVLLF
ncbi:hypothetical protein pb186bvf_001852 [Paramecium bursaria]